MTIIVLRSSCSPLAVHTGRSSRASTNDARRDDFHNRAEGFSTEPFSSPTQTSFDRATSHTAPNNHVAAREKQITSLPLQCDVTILPDKARFLSSLDPDEIQAAFVISTEILHPCGRDNVLIVQSELEAHDRPSHFSLGLTNCWAVSEEGNSTLLPVDAVPSTLRFPLRHDGRDLMRGLNQNGHYSTTSKDGKDFLEGHVTFDFAAAWREYRKNIAVDAEEKSMKQEIEIPVQDIMPQNEATQRLANNSTTAEVDTSSDTSEVASILRSLDQETRFLNRAIAFLFSFGVAMLWVAWKIIQQNSRDNRNDRYRVRIVDSLPREIRMSTLRSQRQRNVRGFVTPKSTPRTPHGVDRAEMTEKDRDQTCHEKSYVVSLVRGTETPVLDDQDKNIAEESLRPWYEDYLSPSIDVTQDCGGLARSIDDTVMRDDTARSLFATETPEHSSNFNAVQSTEISDGQLLESDSSVLPSSYVHDFSSSQEVPSKPRDENTTREKVMNSSKSQFSAPTTNINLIELADHIEASSTPFPRQINVSLISPDEIKRVADKIRGPDATPSRPPEEVVTLVDSFPVDDCESGGVDSSDGIGSKLSAIFDEPKEISDTDPSSNFLSQPAVVTSANACLQIDEAAKRDDANSIVDLMSSSSLLVSLNENEGEECDQYFISGVMQKLDDIDSMSSASLLVSRHDDGSEDDDESTEDEIQRNVDEFKLAIYQEADPIDQAKDMSAHDMKHSMIQELKESSRFKFKKAGANAASNFAEELAVVTGIKAATLIPHNDDFASSLAKWVEEKEKYKTPAKRAERKTLTPVTLTSSPAQQSIDNDSSEFFSDYL